MSFYAPTYEQVQQSNLTPEAKEGLMSHYNLTPPPVSVPLDPNTQMIAVPPITYAVKDAPVPAGHPANAAALEAAAAQKEAAAFKATVPIQPLAGGMAPGQADEYAPVPLQKWKEPDATGVPQPLVQSVIPSAPAPAPDGLVHKAHVVGVPAPAAPVELAPVGDVGPAPVQQHAPQGGGGVAGPQKSAYDRLTGPETKALHGLQFGALATQAAFTDASGVAASESALELARIKAESSQKLAQDLESSAAAEAKRQGFLRDMMSKHEAEADALSKENIDPGRFWAKKDTGSKVLSGIAVVLGAIGQTLAGGTNPAIAQIDAAIQQDIDAQKANLQGKHAALTQKKGLYAQRVGIFADERMAEQSAKASYYQYAAAKVDALGAKSSSEQVKIQSQALAAKLYGEAAMFKQGLGASAEQTWAQMQARAAAAAYAKAERRQEDLWKSTLATATKRSTEMGGNTFVVPKGGIIIDGQKYPEGMPLTIAGGKVSQVGTAEHAPTGPGGSNKLTVTTITGWNPDGTPNYGTLAARNKDAAEKFAAAKVAYEGVMTDLGHIEALRKKHNGGSFAFWDTDDKAAAAGYAKSAQSHLKGKAFADLGVISGHDLPFLVGQVPDQPLEWRFSGALGEDPIGRMLADTKARVQAGYDAQVSSYTQGGEYTGPAATGVKSAKED